MPRDSHTHVHSSYGSSLSLSGFTIGPSPSSSSTLSIWWQFLPYRGLVILVKVLWMLYSSASSLRKLGSNFSSSWPVLGVIRGWVQSLPIGLQNPRAPSHPLSPWWSPRTVMSAPPPTTVLLTRVWLARRIRKTKKPGKSNVWYYGNYILANYSPLHVMWSRKCVCVCVCVGGEAICMQAQIYTILLSPPL